MDIDAIANLSDASEAPETHDMEEVRRAILSLEQSYREPLVLQVQGLTCGLAAALLFGLLRSARRAANSAAPVAN